MTNREWLESLSDEQLAKWLYDFSAESNMCKFIGMEHRQHNHCWDYKACEHWCLTDFLNAEHKEVVDE